MGSWLGTCGITQLPINYGDKIRAFVIVPGYHNILNEFRGFSYPDSIWKPFGVGIKCQYQDYGSVFEIKKDLSSKLLEKAFDENAKDPAKVIFDNKELKGIERYMALIGGDSFVNKKDQPFGIFYVLEDIYQAMVNYNPIEMNDGVYQPLKTILTDDAYRWYNNLLNTPSKKYFISDRVRIAHSPSGSSNYFILDAFNDCIDKKLSINDKKVKELIELAVENYMFEYSMLSARKAWMPQAGAGSQNDGLNVYNKIAATTQKIIDKSIKKSIKEYGEDYNADDEAYSQYQIECNRKALE